MLGGQELSPGEKLVFVNVRNSVAKCSYVHCLKNLPVETDHLQLFIDTRRGMFAS